MNTSKIKSDSQIMTLFRKIGLESIAWSLRRLYCPVDKNDLVLEVGSGGSPYFRANVLCDAFEETSERYFAPLIKDRPTIIAFAEKLPFKNEAFDFVIASHVLEHSADPTNFLSELQRVAKAGYIEVPDAFMERLTNYTYHRLEISEDNNGLVIKKKKDFIEDKELYSLFRAKASDIFPKWMASYPFQFHVRYYWSKNNGGIKFKIVNPKIDCNWSVPNEGEEASLERKSTIGKLKTIILSIIRGLFSQNKRNKSIDINSLLRCSNCQNEDFNINKNTATCRACKKDYKIFIP